MKPGHLLITFLLFPCIVYAQDASTLIYKVEGKEIAYPRLSADGITILYQSNQDGPWSIHILNLDSGKHTDVVVDEFNNNFPDWSYDNQRIAFTSDRDGNEEIYIMNTDGTGMQRITDHPGRDIHPYFAPDDRSLLFNSTRTNGSFDIFKYDLVLGTITPVSASHEHETCARYSSDMKHIVYLRNGATADEIVVSDNTNTSKKVITDTPNVYHGWPVFSHDGKWVYYSSQECGTYCVYRSRLDGSEKTQLTMPGSNIEDARVSVSRDGQFMIFNRRIGKTIEIRRIDL